MYVLSGKFALIDQQGNRQECSEGEGTILPKGWTGTFEVPESVRKRFTKAVKRAGLPHFTPHDLRSTFGTWLAADGVDVVTIKNLMGHTDVKTTMKYLHAAPNRMEWAVERLAGANLI